MAKKGFDRSANDRNKFWDDSVASRARTFVGSEYTGSLNAAASGLNAVGQLSAHNSVNPLDGIKAASSTDVRDWGGELIFDHDRYSASVGSLYEAMTGHSYHESFTTDIMTASLQYYYMNRSETQYSLMDVQYINGTGSFNYIPGIDPQKFGSNYSWRVVSQSGLTPWYSSYDEFNEDVRAQNQNYSVLPEWRISDNLEYYVDQKGGDFRAENTSSFYAVAEDLLTNDDVDKAIAGDSSQDKITIKCDVLKKLLPYNGFYPANRTVQIGELFSQSFGPHIYGLDSSTNFYGLKPSKQQVEQWRLQSLLQPFFAPGIMYNSVKSGIAVDWAAYTGSAALEQLNLQTNFSASLTAIEHQYINYASDSNGNVYVAYFDYYRDRYGCLNNTGSHWQDDSLEIDSGAACQHTSIVIDSNDKPHIVFGADGSDEEKVLYYNKTGSVWIKEVIGAMGAANSSDVDIALDSNNKPHIVFYSTFDDGLWYANHTGSLWYSCSLDSVANVGRQCHIVLDSYDKAYISYRDTTNTQLKCANHTGSLWQIDVVDTAADVGVSSDIAITRYGNKPFIAYGDNDNLKIWMANLTGSSWIVEEVASDYYASSLINLELDSSDKPYVGFTKEFNPGTQGKAYMLFCANKTGSSWEEEKVSNLSPALSCGQRVLAMDKSGTLYYLFRLQTDANFGTSTLKYTKVTNNYWKADAISYFKKDNLRTEAFGMVLDSKNYPTLCCVGWNELFSDHIGYYSIASIKRLTRENDLIDSKNYHKWTATQIRYPVIDWVAGAYGFSQALDSNDKAYVVYGDNQSLMCANNTGSGWTYDIVSGNFDATSDVYMSVAVHDDHPHISFMHDGANTVCLKYANKTGALWQVDDVVCDTNDDMGRHSAIAMDDNGKPFISFYDKALNKIKLINKTGSLWISESIETLVSDPVGSYTSLAFDNNWKPYVLYYDGNYRIRLANHTGSNWMIETVITGAAPGPRCRSNSLDIDSNGNPRFIYVSLLDGGDSLQLRYCFKTGTGWHDQIVDSGSDIMYYGNIAISSDDKTYIGYTDYKNSLVKVATYNDYTDTFSSEIVFPSTKNDIGMMLKQPNYRLPFESMLTPGQYIPLSSSTSANKLYFLAPSWYKQLDDTVPSDYWRYPYCVYDGKGNSVRYEMAINNFFGEVPRFFLRDNNLVSFNSKKESEFSVMNSGHTYYMDVSLFKTDDFQMFKSPLDVLYTSSVTQICPRMQSKSFGYDGQYFGPAVTAYGSTFNTTSLDYYYKVVSDPAYAAYTPPYFYGKATARLSFTVPYESRRYTLNEIFSNMRISYVNDDMCEKILTNAEIDPRTTGSILFDSAMPVSASVNVRGKARAREISFGTEGDKLPRSATDVASSDFDVWTIGTKWECPTLNFKYLSSSYDYDTISGSGFEGPRGMWLDYGKMPTNNQGIYVSIEESFKQRAGSTAGEYQNTGSLLEVCGFKPEARRVGELASVKEISEAIVMVPFSDVPISNMTVLIDGKNFFKIDKEIYDYQKLQKEKGEAAVLAGKYGAVEDIVDTSISKMQAAMKRYYFPPRLDFSTYADIDPFVVYVFEFRHMLDKEDLSLIWQNLMPKIARTVEKDTVEISHGMEQYEFFHGKAIPDSGIRWMIFKVKRKAETSYWNVTSDSTDDNRFKFDFKVGGSREPEYTYNYPYDYFSLIECAKVEASVDYVAKDLQKISPETKKKVVEDARDLGSKAIEKELAKAVPVVVSSEPTVRTKQQEAEEFVFVSKVEKSDLLSKNIPSLTTERKKVVAKTGNAVDSTKSRVSTSARKTSAVKTPTTITKKTVNNKLTTRKK